MCRLTLPVGGSPGVDVVGGLVASGRFGDGGDRVEDGDDGGGPRPGFGDLHSAPPAAADQSGCHVEEAVAQRFGLAQGQNCDVSDVAGGV